MIESAFQDSGSVTHCFGCGADNPDGLQIKSYWDGNDAVCTWTPARYHIGGDLTVVYGGIISCLVDCHSVNLAIATAYRAESRAIGSEPKISYVSAQLNISLQKPTPMGVPLQLKASVTRVDGRKTWVSCSVSANGIVTAQGEILAIRIRETPPAK
jgi:hypothetical protein